MKPQFYQTALRSRLAHMISELLFEEVITCTQHLNNYTVKLPQATYSFKGWKTIWGMVRIIPQSIRRNQSEDISPIQFMIDAQHQLNISDITLANYIEDLQNTLYSESIYYEKLDTVSLSQLADLTDVNLEQYLNAHPKLIANRGRIGWGTSSLSAYSPESGKFFKLNYLAIKKSYCSYGFSENYSQLNMMEDLFDENESLFVKELLKRKSVSLENYILMPVHPWQYQHYIQPQFSALFHNKTIIDLGVLGDFYTPRISIRTLTNVSRPNKPDLKVAITIINTSCYRGIPAKYIKVGHQISDMLKQIISSDKFLSTSGMNILEEFAGIHCDHPYQSQIANPPYRYNEMLGAIFRTQDRSLCQENERCVLTSSLAQTDKNGKPLILEYIARSGLSVSEWILQYANTVIVPLYHLMCKYGIAMVSHGQNISLIMKDYIPVSAILKDFHGDLRIVDSIFDEHKHLSKDVRDTLTHLPANYLIHDLVTGHFLTLLRYVSPLLEEHAEFPETSFYQNIKNALSAYISNHPELAERFKLFPLFETEILKVTSNKVWFKVGYGDTAERPLPELGTPLKNPFVGGLNV